MVEHNEEELGPWYPLVFSDTMALCSATPSQGITPANDGDDKNDNDCNHNLVNTFHVSDTVKWFT